MSSASASIAAVPYATPIAPRPSAFAGAAIIVGGLAMIFLGGCFMIGAMLTINGESAFGTNALQPPSSMTPAQILFVSTMYLLALGCFAGAAAMLTTATRRLLRLMDR